MAKENNPNIYIYLDDFENGDLFQLTAAFVPIQKKHDLTKDWNSLRQNIKDVLISDYPEAKDHPKLQGERLPEIHAVDMFQSKLYFRKYGHGINTEDPYWLKHYDWIEQALKIIQKHNISFLPWPIYKSKSSGLAKFWPILEIFTSINANGIHISTKKVERTISNPYVTVLPSLLVRIEKRLQELGLKGKIICDDHDMSKGFSVVEAISWLRKTEGFTHLSSPQFKSSLDETLIQVADLLSYISGKYLHDSIFSNYLHERIDYWFINYVNPLMLSAQHLSGENSYKATMIAMDFVFEQTVNNPELLTLIRKRLKVIYQEMLDEL